jgi:hypothetical protein
VAAVIRSINPSKNVHWFNMPPEWNIAEFVVFIGDADLPDDSLPPRSPDTEGAHTAVGPLPLRDGRKVWLRHIIKPVPEDRKAYVLQVRDSVTGIAVDQSADQLRALALVMDVQGSTLVTVPFGLETIQTRA